MYGTTMACALTRRLNLDLLDTELHAHGYDMCRLWRRVPHNTSRQMNIKHTSIKIIIIRHKSYCTVDCNLFAIAKFLVKFTYISYQVY